MTYEMIEIYNIINEMNFPEVITNELYMYIHPTIDENLSRQIRYHFLEKKIPLHF